MLLYRIIMRIYRGNTNELNANRWSMKGRSASMKNSIKTLKNKKLSLNESVKHNLKNLKSKHLLKKEKKLLLELRRRGVVEKLPISEIKIYLR